MVYLYLAIAIVFEVGWAISMKLSHGFTRWLPSSVTIVLYLLSVVFLALATKRLPLGATYAIWTGAGAALIASAGAVHFDEPMTMGKMISIALIIAGIVGLNLTGGGH